MATDNDFAAWGAYCNSWWPHKYMIDQDGVIRYDRIGEGGYLTTEEKIRELLAELGQDTSEIPIGGVIGEANTSMPITRELYAGYA